MEKKLVLGVLHRSGHKNFEEANEAELAKMKERKKKTKEEGKKQKTKRCVVQYMEHVRLDSVLARCRVEPISLTN